MKLVKAGCAHRHPSTFFIERPDGSGNWLLLVTKTPGIFRIHENVYEVNANTIILFRKGTPQFYGANGEEYCDDWMHMDITPEDEAKINHLEIPIDIPVQLGDTVRISSSIREIYREYRSGGAHASETIHLHFLLILYRIRETMDARNSGSTIHLRHLNELRAEIYLSPNEVWTIDRAASLLNLSRSTAQHLYRETFGISIIDDLIESRIARAKHLLEISDSSIFSIAESCGYASDIHFIRQFKQRTGTTPLRYQFASRNKKSSTPVQGRESPPLSGTG